MGIGADPIRQTLRRVVAVAVALLVAVMLTAAVLLDLRKAHP